MTTTQLINAIVALINYDCSPLKTYLDVAPRREYIRQEVATMLNALWGNEGRGDEIAYTFARVIASQNHVTQSDVEGHLFDSMMDCWY